MRSLAFLSILAMASCASGPSTPKQPSSAVATAAPQETTEAPAPAVVAPAPTAADSVGSPRDAEAQEPPEPAPLPEGTVVLHVGSSTAGALGLDLKKELEARNIKCILRAKHSTYIPEWAGSKMGLRGMLSQYQPDLVIVSLGGNEVEITDPTRRIKPIQRLVEAIGDRPCVWVGTPRWKRLHHTGLMEVIRDHSAPCRYVDSDELVPNLETLKDGVHPTMGERKRWARRLIQWLEVNRDPSGEKPWSFKSEPVMPPGEAETKERPVNGERGVAPLSAEGR